MKKSPKSKYLSKLFTYLILILLAMSVIGCSTDDLINSASDALGFSMHSSSDSDGNVEIEYYEHESKDSTNKPTSDKSNSKATDKGKDSNESDDATSGNDITSDLDSNAIVESIGTDDPANKIYYRQAATPGKVTISFAGDVTLTEGCSVLNYIKRHDNAPANSFDKKLYERLTGCDIFLLNNEFPYSHRGAPLEGKKYTFRANPDDAPLLFGMGADIVSLANNHCYDYGPDALIDTCETLRNIDMPYIGAGENIEEASKPAYFNINGKTIAFIAATQIEGYANPETKEATETTPGVLRCLDTTRVCSIIEEAKTKSDFVICYIHWGTEKYDLIRDWQKNNAIAMIDAGADLIVGAHSHCLQGIDYLNGVPVVYSLGNFLFNSNTQDTALFTVTLDTSCADSVDIDSMQFVPCIQSGGQTVQAGENDWNRIIQYEQGISYHALLDSDGYVTYTDQNMNTQNGRNTSPMRDKSEDSGDNQTE